MNSVNAFFNGINAVFQLRDHTAAYKSIIDQFLCFVYMKFRNQTGWIIFIFINAFNIRKERKFLCMYSLCNGTCGIICINIISSKIIIITHRENDRQEIFFKKIFQNLRLNLCNFTYKTNISALCLFFTAFQQTTVFTTDTYSIYTEGFYHGNQFLVYFCKNHLCNFHSIFICYTKTIDKFRLHTYLANPAADFLTAAMNDDRFKTNQFQKNNILDHILLQFIIQHGTSAVLYNYNLTIKSLNIRKRLDQHLRLVQVFLINHLSFSLFPGSV